MAPNKPTVQRYNEKPSPALSNKAEKIVSAAMNIKSPIREKHPGNMSQRSRAGGVREVGRPEAPTQDRAGGGRGDRYSLHLRAEPAHQGGRYEGPWAPSTRQLQGGEGQPSGWALGIATLLCPFCQGWQETAHLHPPTAASPSPWQAPPEKT